MPFKVTGCLCCNSCTFHKIHKTPLLSGPEKSEVFSDDIAESSPLSGLGTGDA